MRNEHTRKLSEKTYFVVKDFARNEECIDSFAYSQIHRCLRRKDTASRIIALVVESSCQHQTAVFSNVDLCVQVDAVTGEQEHIGAAFRGSEDTRPYVHAHTNVQSHVVVWDRPSVPLEFQSPVNVEENGLLHFSKLTLNCLDRIHQRLHRRLLLLLIAAALLLIAAALLLITVTLLLRQV